MAEETPIGPRPEPYQRRVIRELSEASSFSDKCRERAEKLRAFLHSPPSHVTASTVEELQKQLEAMTAVIEKVQDYESILFARVRSFDAPRDTY